MDTDTHHRINFYHNSIISRPYLNSEPKRCSGRGCTQVAENLLSIVYIKKRGYFCDACTQDLIAMQLAVKIEEVIPND
jgi:hypothetical protein